MKRFLTLKPSISLFTSTIALMFAGIACGDQNPSVAESSEELLSDTFCDLHVSGRLEIDSRDKTTGLRALEDVTVFAEMETYETSLGFPSIASTMTDSDGNFTITTKLTNRQSSTGVRLRLSYKLKNQSLTVWGDDSESKLFVEQALHRTFFDSELLSGSGGGSYSSHHFLEVSNPKDQMLFSCGSFDLGSESLLHFDGGNFQWIWKSRTPSFRIADPNAPVSDSDSPWDMEDKKTEMVDLEGLAGANFFDWSRASIWVDALDFIEHARSLGSNYAFQDRVEIRYPHNFAVSNKGEASSAGPLSKQVRIYGCAECADPAYECTKDEREKYCDDKAKNQIDHFGRKTTFHELAHVWAYEKTLLLDLILSSSTHQTFEEPGIAFHEGFADYVADELDPILRRKNSQPAPLARTKLTNLLTTSVGVPVVGAGLDIKKMIVASYSTAEENDAAWSSFLKILSRPNLETYDFGYVDEAGLYPGNWNDYVFHYPLDDEANNIAVSGAFNAKRCRIASPELSLKEVLRVFLPAPRDGYNDMLSWSELTFDGFLNRAVGMSKGINLTSDQATLTRYLINPERDVQPWEHMDCSL